MNITPIIPYPRFETDEAHDVAIACSRTSDGCHTGLLIKLKGKTRMLHLAFHNDLRFDDQHRNVPDRIVWVNFGYFNPDNDPKGYNRQRLIAFAVNVFRKKEKSIPYGIGYYGAYFGRNGKLVLQPGAVGLTCATFLLALFRGGMGIHLLDYQSWPPHEDDSEIRERAARYMRIEDVDEAHIARVEGENVQARYLPEEVTAASAQTPLPAGYAPCRDLGIRIHKTLFN